MQELIQKKCIPCEGGVKPLTYNDYKPYLSQLNSWQVTGDEKALEKEFQFKNFKQALDFLNKVGILAETERHHPDLFLYGWNKVKISLYTHSISGLSVNDFILAAKIDIL